MKKEYDFSESKVRRSPYVARLKAEAELCFQSSFVIEEIEKNFEDFEFFPTLVRALEEALACERGEVPPGTVIREISLPDE